MLCGIGRCEQAVSISNRSADSQKWTGLNSNPQRPNGIRAMINKSTVGLVAGICGGLFIGYCIYFDKKRRSDPNYKKKVLEKRRRELEEKERKGKLVVNFNDPLEVQRVFLQELEQGEELLGLGRYR